MKVNIEKLENFVESPYRLGLIETFDWGKQPEGYMYWLHVYGRLLRGNFDHKRKKRDREAVDKVEWIISKERLREGLIRDRSKNGFNERWAACNEDPDWMNLAELLPWEDYPEGEDFWHLALERISKGIYYPDTNKEDREMMDVARKIFKVEYSALHLHEEDEQ